MPLNKFLHKNYTLNQATYQLKLPLNIETVDCKTKFQFSKVNVEFSLS